MPSDTTSRLTRARAAILSAAILAVFLPWPAALAHLAGGPSLHQAASGGGSSPDAEFVREVPVAVNDVIYNPADQTLYVSVPSRAGGAGNSIMPVNPATGETGAPAFVGSEPGRMALADDNRTLYVALEGAYAVRRFDTQTRAAGAQFALGRDPVNGHLRANDLAVAPGNPNVVAVARYYLNVFPSGAGAAVYDNGVRRAKTGPGGAAGVHYVAFSASESKLYGHSNEGLKVMTLDATGVASTAAATSFQLGFRIKSAGGRVYTGTGQVVDPETGMLLGTFPGVGGTGAFAPDPANGRIYYVTADGSFGRRDLKAFDINTFALLGSAELSGVGGFPTELVRWGANGLAVRTDSGRLYLIQSSLVSTSDPIPTPTATPTATPTPTPPATFVRQLDLPTNDLIYDPARQGLLVSVPSRAGARGNGVARVNPETGEIGASTFVGSEPGRLALADDNQTLYVGLIGANAIRRLDASSQTAGPLFHLGIGSVNDFPTLFFPGDIEVMPGRPGTIAVSRTSGGSFTTDVLIYDEGVARPKGLATERFTFPTSSIEFGATPDRLYAGSHPLNKLAVGPDGLTKLESFPVGPLTETSFSGRGATHFAGGLLYYSDGLVVDPETGEVKGRFGDPTLGNAMTVDEPNGRAYFLERGGSNDNDSVLLRAYDIRTFHRLAQVEIRGPNMGSNAPSSLVRWGKNGLAFRTRDRIFLVNSALVDATEPVASPTPTPTATPTPTPPYIASFITRIEVPANDLAYEPSTGMLHASVPSAAGAERGNTITTIDPAAATVGASTFIGSEPGRLALSPEGGVLYAYLGGAKAVRRFDTRTRAAGTQFAVGAETPWDMDVVPGSPDSLAVSLGGSPNTSGVAVYDNGVKRPNNGGTANSIGAIEFGDSPATLYGGSTFNNGFLVKMALTPSGLSTVSSVRGLFSNLFMEYAAGRVYFANGRAHDSETGQLVGSFGAGSVNNSGGRFVIDTALGRAFFLSGTSSGVEITAYDLTTFLPVGTITIPHPIPGTSGIPASLVRWGPNGLAFTMLRTYTGRPNDPNDIYLVRTALVSEAEPIPSGLRFGAATYAATESAEAGHAVTITVARTGGVSSASTVSYVTSDGTAAAGSDYAAAAGTLTFAPNELTKTFTVPLLDDNVFEGAETFNLTLGSPTGASLLTPSQAVVTINDNEFQPSITAGALSVVEGDAGTTAAEMIVRLSNLTSKTVTVNYTTLETTAQAGQDYVAAAGTLTFQPGELEKRIALQIVGDTVEEINEVFSVEFTGAVNAFGSIRPFITILDDDRRTVQFSAASVTAGEGAGRATATVTRFGDATEAARVDYITLDDTRSVRCDDTTTIPGRAFARCDYATTIDTLSFAPGERQKAVTVPLVDDGHDEPDEFFRVQLFGASGVLLGQQQFVDVRVVDNDAAGAPNPLDGHAFFVRQHYLDFLSREPEPGEPWTGVLDRCANAFNTDPLSAAAACDRNVVSSSFFRSREFELKGYFVYRFYRATLGRRPLYREFTLDMRRVTGAEAAEVFTRRRQFSEVWLLRQDAAGLYGALTNTQFVSALLGRYGLDSIRSPDPAAPDGDARVVLTRAELTAALDAQPQRLTRAQVLRAYVESSEVDAAEFNGAFVAMQYYGYLRRDPEQSGFEAWLAVLNRGEGFRVMIDGFMNSPEYRLRFGKE